VAKVQWSNLSKRSRRSIVAVAAAEAVLKVAVLIDIRRRPASQVRGSKAMWAAATLPVNSAGMAPLAYFAFGRQRPAHDPAGTSGS